MDLPALVRIAVAVSVVCFEPIGLLRAAPPAPSPKQARALLDQARFKEAAAAARAALDELRASSSGSTLEAAQWTDLLVESLCGMGTGQAAELRELTSTAVAVKSRLTGRDSLETADSLDLVGAALAAIDSPKAIEALDRSIAIRARASPSDGAKLARTHELLAQVYLGRFQPWRAQPHAQQALDLRRDSLGPNHNDTIHSRITLANVAINLKACEDAAIQLREAHDASRVGEHPVTFTSDLLRTDSRFEKECGDLPKARSLAREALEWDQRERGPDDPLVALDLVLMRDALLGTFKDAEGARAQSILEAAFGAHDPRVALSQCTVRPIEAFPLHGGREPADPCVELLTAAHGAFSFPVLWSRADLADSVTPQDAVWARAEIERFLPVLQKEPDVPPIVFARRLTNLGIAYAFLGDTSTAAAMIKRVVKILDENAIDDRLTTNLLLDAGETLGDAGDLAVSRSLYERAIRAIERRYGPESVFLANALQGYAYILINHKEYVAARPLALHAVRISESVASARCELPWSLLRLCEIDKRVGSLKTALATCVRARRAAVDAGEVWLTNHVSARVGAIHIGLRQPEAALRVLLDSQTKDRERFLSLAERLSEREALGLSRAGMDLLLSVLGGTDRQQWPKNAVRLVWDDLVRSRALVQDELGERLHALNPAYDPGALPLIEKLSRSRSQLSRAFVSNLRQPSPRSTTEVYEARSAMEAAERSVGERTAKSMAARPGRRVGLDAVARALPDGVALVAYAAYRQYPSGPKRDSQREYMAFVLAPGAKEPDAIPLGSAATIDALVQAWRTQVSTAPPLAREKATKAESEYVEAAAALRRAIWDPVLKRLGRPEVALIVPDGALGLVNFQTLPADDGSYLVEHRPMLHTLSAERVVASLPDAAPASGRLLALGAPDFDRSFDSRDVASAASYRGSLPTCESFGRETFDALPWTRVEVDRIAALWDSQAGNDDPARKAVRLTGGEAVETRLKQLGPGSKVVHLATHGVFLDDACRSDSDPKKPNAAESYFAALALAGANRRVEAKAEQDDGILTGEEIASLDLHTVEWVVLSACNSGLGKALDSEGLFGLRRSFQIAGAHSVIASLWPIKDEATGMWIERLYRSRADGAGTAEAIREADLSVIDARRKNGRDTHPFHWGAFVGTGDWR